MTKNKMEIETLYCCINKYLEGEATEIEISKIDQWYESFDCTPGFTEEEKRDVTKNGDLIFFQLSAKFRYYGGYTNIN